MCGVTGFWVRSAPAATQMQEQADRMADTLRHRGPDDAGGWVDANAGIALGHRRLSIVDLSPTGHQPMFSADGRWVISFNGEIYNFLDLRDELTRAGSKFRSTSDTEVMLEAVSTWGFERALARFEGMFAFALWDRNARRLYLVRDRLGKKPMYLFQGDGVALFGSELKALCAHPTFPRKMDPRALPLFLRYNCIPSPLTIYADTIKLLPGQYAVLTENAHGGPGDARFYVYWDALAIAHDAVAHLFSYDENEIITRAEELLTDVVRKRMIADVPIGALLSGGIDSSLVTALMQKQSARPIRTFTIGFAEAGMNEAEYARTVAQHLGTDHTMLYVTPQETLNVIPHLAEIYDEPFADSSQVPTFAVSKLARTQVTVALSGDGGDELFGGYNRYSWARQAWWAVGWLPAALRHLAAQAVRHVSQDTWDHAFEAWSPVLPRELRVRLPGDKAYKLAQVLDSADADEIYRRLVSCWGEPREILTADLDATDSLIELQHNIHLRDFSERMMLLDLKTYLPEDILVKVDRASMATSLEARAPFLDHRVAEFVWHLPVQYRVRGSRTKWLLRQVLYRYVPRELVERPKAGFGLPVGEWLRGALKEWAEELLSEQRLNASGLFRASVIRRYWKEHASGKRNWQYRLWSVLMFQAWQEKWRAS